LKENVDEGLWSRRTRASRGRRGKSGKETNKMKGEEESHKKKYTAGKRKARDFYGVSGTKLGTPRGTKR